METKAHEDDFLTDGGRPLILHLVEACSLTIQGPYHLLDKGPHARSVLSQVTQPLHVGIVLTRPSKPHLHHFSQQKLITLLSQFRPLLQPYHILLLHTP